ncbi:MAG: aminotransferase class V-fold PLP-dependent enzyme, partial [Thermoanaerobaculia bacterium]
MDDTLLRLRKEEFPITERYVYLNHAASGPLPRRTVARLTALAEAASLQGDRAWFDRVAEMERVRGLAARLLGAKEPCEVTFVENTSTGLSWVAEGFPWRPGDNVVGAELEFPSNVYPWMRLADYEVEYRQVPERDGRIDPDELLGLLDDNTR